MISKGKSQPPKKLKTGKEENEVIFFSSKDLVGVHNLDNEPIVVSMTIAKHPIKHILVDTRRSTDVLLYDVFVCMSLSMEMLRPRSTPLVTFNGESVEIEGEVTLSITIETLPQTKMMFITFTMVSIPSAYNVILGHPRLNQLDAMVSTK